MELDMRATVGHLSRNIVIEVKIKKININKYKLKKIFFKIIL